MNSPKKAQAKTAVASPEALYVDTLSALHQAKSSLQSEAWKGCLAKATPQQRIDSAAKLIELSNAITTLSNTQLKSIAAEMAEQETPLKATIDGVHAAIEKLEQVQNVLDSITKIIGVVGMIIPLL